MRPVAQTGDYLIYDIVLNRSPFFSLAWRLAWEEPPQVPWLNRRLYGKPMDIIVVGSNFIESVNHKSDWQQGTD